MSPSWNLFFPVICFEFVCSSCVCMGSLWVLQFPPTVWRHADYFDQMVDGLHMLALCWTGISSNVYPALLSIIWDWLQPPCDPANDKWLQIISSNLLQKSRITVMYKFKAVTE